MLCDPNFHSLVVTPLGVVRVCPVNRLAAGVLAGSLQDSSPATHRLSSVRSGPLGIRPALREWHAPGNRCLRKGLPSYTHPECRNSVPRCSKPPVSRSASQPSVSPCVATARHTSLARLTLPLRLYFRGRLAQMCTVGHGPSSGLELCAWESQTRDYVVSGHCNSQFFYTMGFSRVQLPKT